MSARIAVRTERPGFTLDVDLAWDERVAVIFGPSGSGKSTLFEVVLGLVRSSSAQVELGGERLDALPIEQRGLGWVPQEAALFPHLSVEENVRFAPRSRAPAQTASVERAIAVLEIGHLLERSVAGLSGGERQRVAIARAIASDPRALLLDEPLAALDLPLRARVLPYLLRVRDELDIPVLYITHDPDEAQLVGEVVVVLDGGRAVATGPPREVLWSRAVLPLSEALGLDNVIDARVVESGDHESAVEAGAGVRFVLPFALETGSAVRLGLRAQDLLLSAERPGRISARNVLPGRVLDWEEHGGDALVRVDVGVTLVAKVTPAAVGKLALARGAPIFVVVKAQALRRLA